MKKFKIEYIPEIKLWRLTWKAGGCRPATDPEIAMWKRLKKMEGRRP